MGKSGVSGESSDVSDDGEVGKEGFDLLRLEVKGARLDELVLDSREDTYRFDEEAAAPAPPPTLRLDLLRDCSLILASSFILAWSLVL
jgi:hypothetical protein